MRVCAFAITTVATWMAFLQGSAVALEDTAVVVDAAPIEEQPKEALTPPPAASAVNSEVAIGDLTHLRNNPIVVSYEVDEEVDETPELLAAIQEALVMSANEAHGNLDMQFYAAAIKGVIHENLEEQVTKEEEDDDEDVLLEEDEDEEEEEWSFFPAVLRGRSRSSSKKRSSSRTPWWADKCKVKFYAYTFPHRCRKVPDRHYGDRSYTNDKNKKNIYRRDVNSGNIANCNLCPRNPNDDDSLMLRGEQAALVPINNQFYSTFEGRSVMAKWQVQFCKKLRRIPALGKPTRCFIHFDSEHEDPLESLPAEVIQSLAAAMK